MLSRYYSPPRSSLMQFQALRGTRNYAPRTIKTRRKKNTTICIYLVDGFNLSSNRHELWNSSRIWGIAVAQVWVSQVAPHVSGPDSSKGKDSSQQTQGFTGSCAIKSPAPTSMAAQCYPYHPPAATTGRLPCTNRTAGFSQGQHEANVRLHTQNVIVDFIRHMDLDEHN